MAIKDLLVSVDASQTGRERMTFALNLAQRHRARVTAYYTSPTVGLEGEASASDLAEDIEREFEAQLGLHQLTGGWMLSNDDLSRNLIEEIRYTDLAVLGLGPPDARDFDAQGFPIAEIVVACGRPVLGIPVSQLSLRPFTKVLIAWDGSREATRALHDAIPLIQGAKEVSVITIGADAHGMAQRAVDHLLRHDVKASVATAAVSFFEVGPELLQQAAMLEVDLMVAGAYGHAKLTEDLLGGSSRSLLHQMLVPVLLSH
jgi:nucleotide-binding universal stress UspA family protein